MFGSVVLDVAIGMVFIFLLMSLIASVVQEMLATFMQLRPANLLGGLNSVCSGDSLGGEDLVDSLYNHGLIRGLFADPKKDLKDQTAEAGGVQSQRRLDLCGTPHESADMAARKNRICT